jgi:hypothetical protein
MFGAASANSIAEAGDIAMSFETAVFAPVSVEINRGMAVCPHTEIRKIFEEPL